MQKLIVSLKLSRYRPRSCFEPHRRAARPSRPSRTTPAMMRADASTHRRSITYVIATKPTIAFARVITSAIETLRTHSIPHLRDRGRPRPHAVPRGDRQAAPRREREIDPRPEAYEPDALALFDLIPGAQVGDDPAGERTRDLREPHRSEAGVEFPLPLLVPPRPRAGGDPGSSRAMGLPAAPPRARRRGRSRRRDRGVR